MGYDLEVMESGEKKKRKEDAVYRRASRLEFYFKGKEPAVA